MAKPRDSALDGGRDEGAEALARFSADTRVPAVAVTAVAAILTRVFAGEPADSGAQEPA
ncbi:MAG: hypothetical protein U1F33_15560 [Alphaproteobacteria bacterium]